ncbi:MAG TPA: DUF1587 domain-containing protein [Pirellulaceae bacterium]|nr:DUF1587 domain-containing protein [Pirellulaceae bacterium]
MIGQKRRAFPAVFCGRSSGRRSPASGSGFLARQRWTLVGTLLLASAAARAAGAFEPQADPGLQLKYAADVRPLLAKYCFECHQGAQAQGGVTLEAYQESQARTKDRPTWQKIARQVQGKIMPPPDEAQPTDAERAKILAWVQSYALTPDCSGPVHPGRVTLRRLNRAEYNNTVRDLFGVTVQPANDFPSDDVGYGFDNIGDVLTLPPVLLERYLDAAEKVVRAAIVTSDLDAAPVQPGKGGELASSGEVGGEFNFPVEAEYILRARACGDQAGPDPARMTFRVDGKDVKTFDVPTPRGDAQPYELRMKLTAGKHKFTAAFINDYYMPKATDPKLAPTPENK